MAMPMIIRATRLSDCQWPGRYPTSLDPFDTWSDFGLDSDLDLDVCWDYCKSLLSVIFWWLALICWSSERYLVIFRNRAESTREKQRQDWQVHQGDCMTRLTSAWIPLGRRSWNHKIDKAKTVFFKKQERPCLILRVRLVQFCSS